MAPRDPRDVLAEEIAELPFTAGQLLGLIGFALLSTFLWWWAFCGRLKERRSQEGAYERLFQRRETIQHHIDWMKRRGEVRARDGSGAADTRAEALRTFPIPRSTSRRATSSSRRSAWTSSSRSTSGGSPGSRARGSSAELP
mmetsp:Transcript_20236/g.61430  ORF Transcript_20236/g.61430 Transcript_20236/m.61430 type:complete len:142 (-) Transcript_20236:302-727(-)